MAELEGFRAAVIATDGFEQSELTDPIEALKDAGAEVTILSLGSGKIQGFKHLKPGKKVKIDETLSDVSPDQFDGLLLPGGALNADTLRCEPAVQSFVRSIQEAGKPIGAICHAPWILSSADLVRGRTLTSYHTIQDDIRNAGGNWVDREVVEDDNWVTSRQPQDIPAFNKALLRLFAQRMATAGSVS